MKQINVTNLPDRLTEWEPQTIYKLPDGRRFILAMRRSTPGHANWYIYAMQVRRDQDVNHPNVLQYGEI